MSPTSISEIFLDGKKFYVKRDDLVDPFLAGNKFRKLHTLLQTSNSTYNTIISYGGTQSNAMLAIAVMCKRKNWEFIYYSKPMSKILKEEKVGNYALAIQFGMDHREIQYELYREYIASLNINKDKKTLLLDQGGADTLAREGVEELAQEIREANLCTTSLAIPSGTGTTALFLALALPEYKIFTTACVGDSSYLRDQMNALHEIPQNLIILEFGKKYHFAKPYPEFYQIYKRLLDTGIEFDLLYAPLMFKALLEQVDEEVLYIHSGGVSGNQSMLKRYQRKGIGL